MHDAGGKPNHKSDFSECQEVGLHCKPFVIIVIFLFPFCHRHGKKGLYRRAGANPFPSSFHVYLRSILPKYQPVTESFFTRQPRWVSRTSRSASPRSTLRR